ncbi:hypothetical protein QTP88_012581 [Uroleucon formosanum]
MLYVYIILYIHYEHNGSSDFIYNAHREVFVLETKQPSLSVAVYHRRRHVKTRIPTIFAKKKTCQNNALIQPAVSSDFIIELFKTSNAYLCSVRTRLIQRWKHSSLSLNP